MLQALVSIGLGFVMVFAAAADAAAQNWNEYRPENGGFRIELPGTPKLNTVPIPVGNDETAPMTEAVVEAGKVSYLVSWLEYPERLSRAVPAEQVLDRVRDGMAADGMLRSEKALAGGNSAGREFLVIQPSRNAAVRIWWAGSRLYQLTVTGGDEIATQPDTRRFLDSFNLVQ